MNRILLLIIGLHFICLNSVHAQGIEALRNRIDLILQDKKAVVGVAIQGHNSKHILSINGSAQFPMLSVFKTHIALFMLSEIDKGKFSLDQKVVILKSELLPGLWSPLREKYPEGDTLTIAEIMEFTVSQSDNAGCDVLLRMLGGPESVENYFKEMGFKDLSIKINEEVMQGDWETQFLNWTTPLEANRVLAIFYDNKNNLLSQESYDFFWKMMRETSTGMKRLKGKLPVGTIVAHKTGTSGTNKYTGITAAVNDIGMVFLPNGSYFIISVLITESKEDYTVNDEIIADISKAAWDFFMNKKK